MAVAQERPEGVDVRRAAGKTARHPDDGDGIGRIA
jgi:hypothetical protein